MYLLQSPYTFEQKVDFLVKHNQEEGLEISETSIGIYALEKDEIMGRDENGNYAPIKNPNWYLVHLKEVKENLIKQNDKLRDIALNSGVNYRDVLFDSDTDQKINLLATYSRMSDEDTIIWYGMNNAELLCNKEDLMNIGQLIVQLHSYCWTKNANIKNQIEEAESVEELENIEINYTEEANDIID